MMNYCVFPKKYTKDKYVVHQQEYAAIAVSVLHITSAGQIPGKVQHWSSTTVAITAVKKIQRWNQVQMVGDQRRINCQSSLKQQKEALITVFSLGQSTASPLAESNT